jgi:hypothetical protein
VPPDLETNEWATAAPGGPGCTGAVQGIPLNAASPGNGPSSRAGQRPLLAILAVCLLGPSAGAQRLTTNVQTATPSNSDTDLPYWASDRFDRLRFMSDFTSHFVLAHDPRDVHAFAFFPPAPPPLESEIPVLAPLDPGPPADPELSGFVGEIFYPFLGVRLAYGELSKAERTQILAYRDAKVAQQRELRLRILALKDADPGTRQAQLAALAAQQSPRIAGLEAMAEKIRSDLRQIRVLGVPVEFTDLNEKPDWRARAADDTPSDPAGIRLEADALRGVAFYQEGLSPDQRYLLFESSIDLESRVREQSTGAEPGARLLYFYPETSRIRIPPGLPEALEAKIGEFVSAKSALMAGLREALRSSQELTSGTRTDVMASLAAAQAPRFAQLEAIAEEIRRGLDSLPNAPGPPSATSLPPDLTARIAAYRAHKVDLLRKLRSMLAAPTPTARADNPSQGPAPADPVASALAWMHDGSSRTEIQSTELRVTVGEFDRMQSELISALASEESGIREALAEYVRSTNGPTDRKSINDLLRDFENARQQQEIWDRYRDYQAAVLMPGLSAGQRRLLFDAGIEQLGLPLPAGEKIN